MIAKRARGVFLSLVLGLFCIPAQATIILAEYGFNVDGDYSDPVDMTGFLFGDVMFTITGAGFHNVGALFDYDINETQNTFWNEIGSTGGGALADNQFWEIDEPFSGDIWDNLDFPGPGDPLELDKGIGVAGPEDVAMAMGWEFDLSDTQVAKVVFSLSEVAPLDPNVFYLKQRDPDFNTNIFMSSTLTVSEIPAPPVLWLMGLGFAGLLTLRRKA